MEITAVFMLFFILENKIKQIGMTSYPLWIHV